MGKRRREPRMTFVSRFARGRRLDRNPLRRASDRAETVVLMLLMVTFLVGAPVAALASGARVHAMAQQAKIVQQAARHQVTATVVEAPTVPPPESGNVDTAAQVRWTAASAMAMTGWTTVPLGTQVGQKVRVWATQSGQLASPPLTGVQVKDLTILGRAAGAGAVAALLALCGLLVRSSLNRRRMAAWDVAWRTTGPRWTTRR